MSLFDHLRVRPPDREEYLALVIAELGKVGFAQTKSDPATFSIKIEGCGTAYLENGFLEYCKARPAERRKILARYLSAYTTFSKEMPSTYAEARGELLPVLRSACYGPLTALELESNGEREVRPLQTAPFADGLVVHLVRDTPETMMFVQENSLLEWQVSADQAHRDALANLRSCTEGPDFREHAPGLFQAAWSDGYSPSRTLLPELFRSLAIEGEPVIFTPNRDQLWVTGDRDAFNQAYLLKLGEEAALGTYSLSPHLYRLQGESWERYWPDDPAVAGALHALGERRANIDYHQQKAALERLFERQLQDVFVATHNLYEDAAGTLFSLSVWTRGVDTLLPRTHRILLLMDAKTRQQITLPWEVVAANTGNLMVADMDYFPPRYRVRAFPSAAVCRKLQALVQPLQ